MSKKTLEELGKKSLIDLITALAETVSEQAKRIDQLLEQTEALNDRIEELTPSEDQEYIDSWNKDQDNFERIAYGDRTPEEGGIRDASFDSIRYNEAGEPDGYC